MSGEITHEINIGGLQNLEKYNSLNPTEIHISDNNIVSASTKYRIYIYCFTGLLLSLPFTNDTNMVFITCNGLNDSRKELINKKIYTTLGVINISQTKNWGKIKKKSRWVNANFTDSEYPYTADHVTFGFTAKILHDILSFSFILLDKKADLISFPDAEEKFQYYILKYK